MYATTHPPLDANALVATLNGIIGLLQRSDYVSLPHGIAMRPSSGKSNSRLVAAKDQTRDLSLPRRLP